MRLFERMMQHPGESAEIAANYAEYLRNEAQSPGRELCGELAAILQERETLAADMDNLTRELATRCSPADDFAALPGPYRPTPESKGPTKEGNEETERLARNIAALDSVFIAVCRAVRAWGITLSGGEISALKRQNLPEALAADLDRLKRAKASTIPAKERLNEVEAAALFEGLAGKGLISGDYGTFCYYLGNPSTRRGKRPKNALSWNGTAAQFAYFIDQFSGYQGKRNAGRQTPWRIKALCEAFGIDERRRLNVIIPALTDKRKKTTRGGEQIAAIFNALPGLNGENKMQEQ